MGLPLPGSITLFLRPQQPSPSGQPVCSTPSFCEVLPEPRDWFGPALLSGAGAVCFLSPQTVAMMRPGPADLLPLSPCSPCCSQIGCLVRLAFPLPQEFRLRRKLSCLVGRHLVPCLAEGRRNSRSRGVKCVPLLLLVFPQLCLRQLPSLSFLA